MSPGRRIVEDPPEETPALALPRPFAPRRGGGTRAAQRRGSGRSSLLLGWHQLSSQRLGMAQVTRTPVTCCIGAYTLRRHVNYTHLGGRRGACPHPRADCPSTSPSWSTEFIPALHKHKLPAHLPFSRPLKLSISSSLKLVAFFSQESTSSPPCKML